MESRFSTGACRPSPRRRQGLPAGHRLAAPALYVALALLPLSAGGAEGQVAPTAASGPGSTLNLFDDYNPATTPHYRHITFFGHAGYIINGRGTPEQIHFDVTHVDHFMYGPTARLKSLMPTLTNIPYAIALTVPIPAYSQYPAGLDIDFNADMKAWYATHPPYDIETAFLHNPDGTRKSVKIWYTGPQNNRWILNPRDRGNLAYQIDRLRRYLMQDRVPADGIFLDEVGPLNYYTGSVEYPATPAGDSARRADLVTFIGSLRAGLGAGKMLMINTGDYSDTFYINLIGAAQASHKELYNNPFTNVPFRWSAADRMAATGAVVVLASPWSQADYQKKAGFVAGNASSPALRGRTLELASYYMVLTTPAQVWFWKEDVPKGFEADLGAPTAVRSLLAKGVDPVGLSYQVWQRPFERGLVLIRPQLAAIQDGQRYDDATAVTVKLPPGSTWHILNMDGTTSGAVTAVALRNAEAMILVK